MKPYRYFVITLIFLSNISLNAQFFVGGNLNFNTNNLKGYWNNLTKKTSTYSLNISPNAGKFLSEKLATGATLDISFSGYTSVGFNETIYKSSSIGISPFLRYYALKWNKLSLFGQGNVGFSFSNSSIKTAGVTDDGPDSTRLYLSIYPGIEYDINEKLSLQTTLNILSLEYNYINSKHGSTTEKTSSFNIGAGLSNIISVSAIMIGGIFKF